MLSNGKYRVKTNHWFNNRLSIGIHFFENYNEALIFVDTYRCDSYKIYDPNDVLLCVGSNKQV